ncbi:hypothetical protein IWX90DRAFT_213430 [Phyllosticta citrichinensis]|uniref:DUF6594 domain-containing protein n=1 Tax=Phyllosticta citrichinensis TaxID=1130410 RepID=A0ABR1XT35_9PEZI
MSSVEEASSLARLRDGYPSLAAHIAASSSFTSFQGSPSRANDVSAPDAFIFRKFDRLSARNLLMLENRGLELEEDLDKLDRMTREGWAWDGRVSRNGKGEGAGVEMRKKEVLGELELWIGKYQQALYNQSLVAALPTPAPSALSSLRRWFSGETVTSTTDGRTNGTTNGSHILARPLLNGSARYKYDNETDLVSLRPSGNSSKTASDVSDKAIVPVPRFLKDNWPKRRKSLPFALAGLPPSTPANSPVNPTEKAGVRNSWSLAPLSLRPAAPYTNASASAPHSGSNTHAASDADSTSSWPTALASTLVFLVIGSATGFYMSHAHSLSASQARGAEGVLILTALFAISVGALTNARRGEVLAATGLYAAVLGGFIVWGALKTLGESKCEV